MASLQDRVRAYQYEHQAARHRAREYYCHQMERRMLGRFVAGESKLIVGAVIGTEYIQNDTYTFRQDDSDLTAVKEHLERIGSGYVECQLKGGRKYLECNLKPLRLPEIHPCGPNGPLPDFNPPNLDQWTIRTE